MPINWITCLLFCFLALLIGFLIGVISTRKSLMNTYKPKGVLRVAYDEDDPKHPAMGLMIESIENILSDDQITLKIERKNFPNDYEYSRENKSL